MDKLTVKELKEEVNKERWDRDNVSVVIQDANGMIYTVTGIKKDQLQVLVLEVAGKANTTTTNSA